MKIGIIHITSNIKNMLEPSAGSLSPFVTLVRDIGEQYPACCCRDLLCISLVRGPEINNN